jgi:hypothetical protein
VPGNKETYSGSNTRELWALVGIRTVIWNDQ